jgi:hypothetical protein
MDCNTATQFEKSLFDVIVIYYTDVRYHITIQDGKILRRGRKLIWITDGVS